VSVALDVFLEDVLLPHIAQFLALGIQSHFSFGNFRIYRLRGWSWLPEKYIKQLAQDRRNKDVGDVVVLRTKKRGAKRSARV
jgi:hypothetical protein